MVQQRLCLTCAAPFEVPAGSKRKFCGPKCWPGPNDHSRVKRNMVEVQCAQCGSRFEREAHLAERREQQGWAHYCSVACRDRARRGRRGQIRVERVSYICEHCGQQYEKAPHEKKQRYCSVRCAHAAMRGRPRGTRGGKLITSEGYVTVYVPLPERPPGKENVARHSEHRVVMARMLGRHLESYETVHHINGDKADNRPENLQLRVGSHGYGITLRCRCCGSSDIETVELAEPPQEV